MSERIRSLREYLKLSQGAFGKRLGVSRDIINNLENGRVEPKEHMIKLICLEFDVSMDWLRDGQGEMFIQLDREDEITKWLGPLMKPDDDNEFIKKFIHMLNKLDVSDWEVLEKWLYLWLKKITRRIYRYLK